MKSHVVIAILALFSLTAHAGLNKWVDAEGKVHYSDSPPPSAKTQSVTNFSGKGQAEAPVTYSTKSYAEREAELKKSRQEKESAAAKKAQEAATTEAKKQNCASARENVRTLEESGRIVTYDANGERVYLDDAAREQRLNAARAAVGTHCN